MNECALNSSCKNTHTITAITKDGGNQLERKALTEDFLKKQTNTTRITPPNFEMEIKLNFEASKAYIDLFICIHFFPHKHRNP